MLVVDATTAFSFLDVTLYAAPDLAYRHADGAYPAVCEERIAAEIRAQSEEAA